MTIAERIEEVRKKVHDGLITGLPEEERQDVLDGVDELGAMWLDTCAHVRALSICAGMIKHPVNAFDTENREQMKQMEVEGAAMLIGVMGLEAYNMFVQYMISQGIEEYNG